MLYATGNYDEALSDAKSARTFQPTLVKAIEKGIAAIYLFVLACYLIVHACLPYAQLNRH